MFDCNENAVFLPESTCDDCSALTARVKRLEEELADAVDTITQMQSEIETLTNSLANKQNKLTAVGNLSIEDNVISFGLTCD